MTSEPSVSLLERPMGEAGLLKDGDSDATDKELSRFDEQNSKHKTRMFYNDKLISATDASIRIVKTKEGPIHLRFKAKHVVDV